MTELKKINPPDIIYECLGGERNPAALSLVSEILWKLANKGWVFADEERLRELDESSLATRPTPSLNEELIEAAKYGVIALSIAIQGLDPEVASTLLKRQQQKLALFEQAIANAQAQQDDAWLEDAIIVLDEGAEPQLGDIIRYNYDDNFFEWFTLMQARGQNEWKVSRDSYVILDNPKFYTIEKRNGKPVVYRPKTQQVKEGE